MQCHAKSDSLIIEEYMNENKLFWIADLFLMYV